MTESATSSKKTIWIGRILSAIPVLMMLFSGVMKLAKPAQLVQEFSRLGFDEGLIIGIGIVEILVVIVYVIPRTAVLGAILVTSYLGGATVTHVRVGDFFLGPVLVGIAAWLGLYLRDPRLREFLPLKRRAEDDSA